jgi:glycosyltransferase involved in cell wall biosynthesis
MTMPSTHVITPGKRHAAVDTRVAVLAMGAISLDTAGRTYLTEVLGTLGEQPGLKVDLHIADPAFDVPNCRSIRYRLSRRLGSSGRIAAEALVARRIRNADYDVLLSPFNFLPVTWRGPCVVVQHNVLVLTGESTKDGHPIRDRYRHRAVAWSLSRATETLTVSEYLRGLILERYPALDPERVKAVPLGVSKKLLAVASQSGGVPVAGAPRVLVVSALWKYKRVDQAIAAFAQATSDLPRAELLIAGPGTPNEERSLKAVARSLGVLDRVKFLGNISHADLGGLYRSSDALLFLSEVESFGLPILEAMAIGVPVVAKRLESLVEIGGDCPVWVEKGASVEEISTTLKMILSSLELRETRVRLGFERASRFTWENTAELTAAALRRAAHAGSAAFTTHGDSPALSVGKPSS